MAEWRGVQGSQQESVLPMPLFLAIDQGGHASRVLVFGTSGEKIVEAKRTVNVQHPQSQWVEQDADALVLSVKSALDEALDKLGERRRQIVAAGLVTQRSNIVCWDRNTGRTLSPAISWQDRRAHHWMQTFDEHASTIRRITGLVPSAHYGASKIHWCLENLTEVKTARARGNLACGPLASFLLFRLLEEKPFVVDAVNASRTLLWDKASRSWSAELLKLFSLDETFLPRCVPNRHEFGSLDIAGQLIPLTVCSGDQSAALFSLGTPTVGSAYLNMGTGAFMQCLQKPSKVRLQEYSQENRRLHKREKPPARLLQSVVWDEGRDSMQVLEATVNGAGSALAEMEEKLGMSTGQSQRNYAHWLASAKNIPLFLNGVAGLGAPFWLPDFNSRFVECDGTRAEPGERIVAVLESILFLVKVNLEEFSTENVEVKQIVISGGLSVLDGVCQRLADVSGLHVMRPKQSEATAKGLAFLIMNTFPEPSLQKYTLLERGVVWSNDATDCFRPASNTSLCERYRQWRIALDDALNEKVG